MKRTHAWLRGLIAGIGMALVWGLSAADARRQPPLTGRKALIVIAFDGFRDEEYTAVAEMLKSGGAAVQVASTKVGTARGMIKARVPVDCTLATLHAADFAAVVFIGGAGARTQLWDNADAQRLAREAAAGPGVLGAICYAPGILAKAGVLKGRFATGFRDHYTQAAFAEGGAKFSSEAVVVDGRLVTADGPAVATPFAEAVRRLLASLPPGER